MYNKYIFIIKGGFDDGPMSDFSMPPPAMGGGAGKPAAFNGSTQVTIPKDVSDSFSVNGVTHKACVPKSIKNKNYLLIVKP